MILGLEQGGVPAERFIDFELLVEKKLYQAGTIRGIADTDAPDKNVFFVVDNVGKIQFYLQAGMSRGNVSGQRIGPVNRGNLPGGIIQPRKRIFHPDSQAVQELAAGVVFHSHIGKIEIPDLSPVVETD